MSARTLVLAGVVAVLILSPPRARADAPAPAARDTTLGGFLGTLADSTDRFFGLSASPTDTAGLDTVLAESGASHRRELSLEPSFDFNRVDGSTPGLVAVLGRRSRGSDRGGWGEIRGNLARALGARTTLGGVRYQDRLWLAQQPFDVTFWGGRSTSTLNRDASGRVLPFLRAICFGNDWTQYERTDGYTALLAHEHGSWRASVGWRDELQSPLVMKATWNLAHRDLELPANLAAVRGRDRELDYAVGIRWPLVPLRTDALYQVSSRHLGSDFEYRRYRASAGLDLSLGRTASLLPQFAYGHLTGAAVPQADFYLGGDATLHTLRQDQRGGTGFAIAKLELITARDVLALLHIPHPEAFPLQGGLFTATGAVWGRDPFGGATPPGVDWPDRRAWASEVGASLLYASPLFFDPGTFLRVSYAWPIGPDGRISRWSVGISHALDLLKAEPRSE
jgi:hypothetical protein